MLLAHPGDGGIRALCNTHLHTHTHAHARARTHMHTQTLPCQGAEQPCPTRKAHTGPDAAHTRLTCATGACSSGPVQLLQTGLEAARGSGPQVSAPTNPASRAPFKGPAPPRLLLPPAPSLTEREEAALEDGRSCLPPTSLLSPLLTSDVQARPCAPLHCTLSTPQREGSAHRLPPNPPQARRLLPSTFSHPLRPWLSPGLPSLSPSLWNVLTPLRDDFFPWGFQGAPVPATRTQTQWDGHKPITVQTERWLQEGS